MVVKYLDSVLFGVLYQQGAVYSLIAIAGAMALFAVAASRARQLTPSGAWAAWCVGLIVTWGLGSGGLFLLFFFFLSAALLGKLFKKSPVRRSAGILQEKGGRRDSLQVLANGGAATLAALLVALDPGNTAALAMFGAALAEAVADTWAGEIGIHALKPPRSLRTGLPVEPGMSGGVTLLGTLAALLGAGVCSILWIVWVARNRVQPSSRLAILFVVVMVSGWLGSVLDSWLGATVQAHYRDNRTEKLTERATTDGKPNTLVRGILWMDNDMVNLMSNLSAVVLAYALAQIV